MEAILTQTPTLGIIRQSYDKRLYLFAYDISLPKHSREALKCLRRWRVDGQLSVHELWLSPKEANDLAVELIECIDPDTDLLLVCQLMASPHKPLYVLGKRKSTMPQILGDTQLKRSNSAPKDGYHLLTYDISEPKKLQKIQRKTAKYCTYLQRSVYIYQGNGEVLDELLQKIDAVMDKKTDEIRVYPLLGLHHLWFLTNQAPPLAMINKPNKSVFSSIVNKIKAAL